MIKSKQRGRRGGRGPSGSSFSLPHAAMLFALAFVAYLNIAFMSGRLGRKQAAQGEDLEKRLLARANELVQNPGGELEMADPKPVSDMVFPVFGREYGVESRKPSDDKDGSTEGIERLGDLRAADASWAVEEAGSDPAVLEAGEDAGESWQGKQREGWREAMQEAEKALSGYEAEEAAAAAALGGIGSRGSSGRGSSSSSSGGGGSSSSRPRGRPRGSRADTTAMLGRVEPRVAPQRSRKEREEDALGGIWDDSQISGREANLSEALDNAGAFVQSMPIMGSQNRTDKVAFMFLTRGRLPFERVWAKFFNQDTQGRHAIFVHAPPAIRYDPRSIWSGRKLPRSSLVKVEWGDPSMVEAEKALLRFALQDPGVSKMVLLSESDIPVQGFDCVHTMITEKPHSFVQSVPTRERFPPKMKYYININMWRKGSQWVVLNRSHAQLIRGDRDFWIWFKRYCTMFSLNPCVADEHYIPTLLALRRAEGSHELIHHGLTYTEWHDGKPSPETFGRKTAVKYKVNEIRRCHYSKGNKKTYYPIGMRELCGEKLEDEFFAGLGNPNDIGLELEPKRPCFAFARKFSQELAAKYAAGFESVTQSGGQQLISGPAVEE